MRTPTPDDIASRVHELAAGVPCPVCGPRSRLRFSWRTIAKIVGISRQTVGNILKHPPNHRGPRPPRPKELRPRKTRERRCTVCGGKIELDECVKCESIDFIRQTQPRRFLQVYA